jgi:hypothetical protein
MVRRCQTSSTGYSHDRLVDVNAFQWRSAS